MLMRAQVLPLILLVFFAFSSGCADKQVMPRLQAEGASGGPVVRDPKGPIPKPQLPPDLAAEGKRAISQTPKPRTDGYGYAIDAKIRKSAFEKGSASPGTDANKKGNAKNASQNAASTNASANTPADTSADATADNAKNSDTTPDDDTASILSTFAKTSILHRMEDSPPESVIGLEQRLSVALGEGRAILNSYGYYAGRVRGRVEKNPKPTKSKPAVVRVTFTPGPQYKVGKTTVISRLPANGVETVDKLPKTLEDTGLPKGAPAVAADVLAAVDKVRETYLDNGYPFAVISNTRYIADHSKRELEAEVYVTPGAFVRMGEIDRHGAPSVRERFIEAQRTWRKGRPWNQKRVDSFNDSLRQSGLFKSIRLKPGEKELSRDGGRTVDVSLESAAERTVNGLVQYHTEFGAGIQAGWEHRNLTGRGDALRITAPIWKDMQEVTANYRLPYFLDRRQNFIARASGVHQDIDAYRMTTGAVAAGIERHLSRNWSLSVMGSVEGGEVKEPNKDKRSYFMMGLPINLSFDNTGSLLNAVKGQRLKLSVAPYQGRYDGNFTVVRSQAEAQVFLPIVGEEKVILAARGAVGAVTGADSGKIPPSVRFYSGGGGSVRGYKYQSLGPRNSDKDPLGGGSFLEGSLEARWNVKPEWGFVGFVDGGTAYENVFSDPGQDMRFGAGVGFRYHTAIGPVRFDIATPLNPRRDDDSYQIYISIGQNF